MNAFVVYNLCCNPPFDLIQDYIDKRRMDVMDVMDVTDVTVAIYVDFTEAMRIWYRLLIVTTWLHNRYFIEESFELHAATS